MRRIPKKLREELASDPEYSVCALKAPFACDGRITWEHAIIFGGKQVQERWAILPLCERHHGVGKYLDAGTLQKERNIWIALNRATETELHKYSKAVDYFSVRKRLNEKFGEYRKPESPLPDITY